MNVTDLLAEFREHRSEEAFAEVMRRYSGLVFSVARRRLSDTALAEECTQEVFVRLVREVSWLKDEPALVCWLHATAHRTAIDRWRKESRRKNREEKAIHLMNLESDSRDAQWKELTPVLDEALGQLNPLDRQAVLLRYFQSQSLRSVGLSLGLSEDAAKMRLRRALVRLQRILGRHGVQCSVACLAHLLQENAVDAGVPAMAHHLDPAAILARAASQGPGLSLIHGGMLLMKTKLAMIVGALILSGWLWHHSTSPDPAAIRSGSDTLETPPAAGAGPTAPLGRTAMGSRSESEAIADSLVHLEDVLRSARRLRRYPPSSLVEALRQCGAAPTNAVAILRHSLASPDYETRHWAVEGLKVVLQLRNLEAGREAARQALAQVAVRPNDPDQVTALQSLFVYPIPEDSTTPSREPISPEVLKILSEGFRSGDPDILRNQMLVADMLNARLTASGQDISGYQQLLVGLLTSGNAHQGVTAAYALTELPGELPAQVFDVLNRALSDTSPKNPPIRIAAALGRLGSDALDAVPALEQLLESYPANETPLNDLLRSEVKKALHAIQSDGADTREDPASAGTPPLQGNPTPGPGSLKQQFRRNMVEPLLATLADPELRRQFDEDAWFTRVTFPYDEAARDAMEEAAVAADPETAQLLRRLKERVATDLPEEQDFPLDQELPARAELLARAQGVNELENMNLPPETMSRVKELARKYRLRAGQPDNATPADLRQFATDLRQIDPQLYRATRRSFLEAYPWLDRVLP